MLTYLQKEFLEQIFEYKRLWKLVLLLIGISLLIIGSYYYKAPDWDVPISLIMAVLAYFTAMTP